MILSRGLIILVFEPLIYPLAAIALTYGTAHEETLLASENLSSADEPGFDNTSALAITVNISSRVMLSFGRMVFPPAPTIVRMFTAFANSS